MCFEPVILCNGVQFISIQSGMFVAMPFTLGLVSVLHMSLFFRPWVTRLFGWCPNDTQIKNGACVIAKHRQ